MNKAQTNPYESGITELTLQDIKNNLKKPVYADYLDLDNVYDFLTTVSASKGRSGFVTISKEKRKHSYEPYKIEEPVFNPQVTTPKLIREKSPILSPLSQTKRISKSSLKTSSLVNLRIVEEAKNQNKVMKNKTIMRSPKQGVKNLGESLLKIKDGVETTRERALSPYGLGFRSPGKLPLLQTSKKRIGAVKLDKVRKKSKGRK